MYICQSEHKDKLPDTAYGKVRTIASNRHIVDSFELNLNMFYLIYTNLSVIV